MNHYKTICEMVNGDISAEVISTDLMTLLKKEKNWQPYIRISL